jgi:hypothetical protein
MDLLCAVSCRKSGNHIGIITPAARHRQRFIHQSVIKRLGWFIVSYRLQQRRRWVTSNGTRSPQRLRTSFMMRLFVFPFHAYEEQRVWFPFHKESSACQIRRNRGDLNSHPAYLCELFHMSITVANFCFLHTLVGNKQSGSLGIGRKSTGLRISVSDSKCVYVV